MTNEPKPKSKGGRPTFVPKDDHRRIVKIMAGFGIPQEQIALALEISKPTLLKHFKRELQISAAQVHAQLAGNLLRLSNGSDGTALKATLEGLRMRFGWSSYAPAPASVEPVKGKKQLLDEAAQPGNEPQEWATLLN